MFRKSYLKISASCGIVVGCQTRGITTDSRYYITEILSSNGYKHIFPDIVKNTTISHDTQTQKSGPCFCMSSIVMRRILSIMDPSKYAVCGSRTDAEEALKKIFGVNPSKGFPNYAMKQIIGEKDEININYKCLTKIIKHCERTPVILPYCPCPPSGKLVVVNIEQHMSSIYSAATMIERNENVTLHSMCVVGIVRKPETNDPRGFGTGIYLVCAQTWDDSQVVLVPLVPNEFFLEKYPLDSVMRHVISLNVLYFHKNTIIPQFPLPPKEPITFHSFGCLAPYFGNVTCPPAVLTPNDAPDLATRDNTGIEGIKV